MCFLWRQCAGLTAVVRALPRRRSTCLCYYITTWLATQATDAVGAWMGWGGWGGAVRGVRRSQRQRACESQAPAPAHPAATPTATAAPCRRTGAACKGSCPLSTRTRVERDVDADAARDALWGEIDPLPQHSDRYDQALPCIIICSPDAISASRQAGTVKVDTVRPGCQRGALQLV